MVTVPLAVTLASVRVMVPLASTGPVPPPAALVMVIVPPVRAIDPLASMPSAPALIVTVPPLISDEPRSWIGKWVGVWILRNAGGVYDTPDEGHLAFAGTIASVGSDDVGRTVIELDHALTRVRHVAARRHEPQRALRGCLADRRSVVGRVVGRHVLRSRPAQCAGGDYGAASSSVGVGLNRATSASVPCCAIMVPSCRAVLLAT